MKKEPTLTGAALPKPWKGAGLLVSKSVLKFQKASGTAVLPMVKETTELVTEP